MAQTFEFHPLMMWCAALCDRTICDLVKVRTDNNLSDIFTKILGPNKFKYLRDHMTVACSMLTPEELKTESPAAPATSGHKGVRCKRRPVRLGGG